MRNEYTPAAKLAEALKYQGISTDLRILALDYDPVTTSLVATSDFALGRRQFSELHEGYIEKLKNGQPAKDIHKDLACICALYRLWTVYDHSLSEGGNPETAAVAKTIWSTLLFESQKVVANSSVYDQTVSELLPKRPTA